MFHRHPVLLKVVGVVAAGLLLTMSAMSLLWAVFCFLGGPDGNRGSRESIVWGSCFGAFAGFMAAIGVLLLKKYRKAA
jgi:hypothetical protein